MYRALHESAYDDLTDRSRENATELADRRDEKYRNMDSNLPETGGGRLIRSDQEQEEVVYTEEDNDGNFTLVSPEDEEATTKREGS